MRLLATAALFVFASQLGQARNDDFVDSERPWEAPPTEPEDPIVGPTPLEIQNTDIREYRPSNQELAALQAASLRENLPCAEWGVIATTSTATYNSKGQLKHKNFLKIMSAYGVSLNLFPYSDSEILPDLCKNITDAATKDGVTAGAELQYMNAGKGPAVLLFYLWRVRGKAAGHTSQALEAQIDPAIARCNNGELSLDDIGLLGPCLGKTMVSRQDPKIAGAFVIVLNEQVGQSAAQDVPSDIGVVKKDVSITAGGQTGRLTIFGLLN